MKKNIVVLLALLLASISAPALACSNFLFDKDGYSLVAHNMEWVSGEGLVVINKRHVRKTGFQVENNPEFTWTSKYGSVSLTFDGRESTGRGMNEAGLVIFEAAMADTQQSRTHDLPLLSVAQWTQYQLDTSATIDDIIASDNVVRIWPDDMQSHFFVWDKSGPAVIEWLNGEMVVYRGSALPIAVINNSTYQSCVGNGDDVSGRFKTIVDGLAAYDPTTASDGISYVYSILRDVNSLVRFPLQSQWSVVFDTQAKRLYISTLKNGDLRYFDLKDFDFSCETAVEVLDINGAGTGNMRSAFVPYTTDLNRAMVRRTYDIYSSYGVTTPDDVIERIVQFPDTTVCVSGDTGGTGGSASGGAATGGAGTPGTSTSGVGGKSGPESNTSTGGTRATSADAGSSAAGGGGTSGTSTIAVSSAPNGASAGCSCRLAASRGRGALPALILGVALLARRRARKSSACGSEVGVRQ